jgi:hypothetical protein
MAMPMPMLYRMLECTRCRSRRVVHDIYLEIVGDDPGGIPGVKYGGRPISERYGCLGGCPETPRIVGSIFSPDDARRYLRTPHEPRPLGARQRREWVRLTAQGDKARGPRGPIARVRAAVTMWLDFR